MLLKKVAPLVKDDKKHEEQTTPRNNMSTPHRPTRHHIKPSIFLAGIPHACLNFL